MELRFDFDVPAAARRFCHQSKRCPDIRSGRIRRAALPQRTEGARHDADQREGLAIEQNGLADLRGICSKAAHPQGVTNDGHALAIALVIFVQKIAAELRLNA